VISKPVVANNTVNSAKWTEGSHIIVRPIRDLIRVKNCLTIKATALLAPFNFCTVIDALFVSDPQRMVFGQ
jgi:NAD/NADP transhydrogenase beta subunit